MMLLKNLVKPKQLLISAVLALGVVSTAHAGGKLRGTVSLDGSSTVFPISEAVAEEFGAVQPRVRVTAGVSGTGGGFKKFMAGEIDINAASRRIKSKELKMAAEKNIEYLELPVAYDGLSVIINKDNDWVDYLTKAELKKMWEPGSKINNWNQVRASFPNKPLRLYGPGHDSGTFDYFTKAINGKSGAARPDYTASEDDNLLVQGISGDVSGLAFFGYAYYIANKDKVKVVPIDGGDGPVAPTAKTINDGSYKPLSRPVFIYVRNDALARPEVKAFVDFYLESAGALAQEVGYIQLKQESYEQSLTLVGKTANAAVAAK